jgi:hypothetical protein
MPSPWQPVVAHVNVTVAMFAPAEDVVGVIAVTSTASTRAHHVVNRKERCGEGGSKHQHVLVEVVTLTPAVDCSVHVVPASELLFTCTCTEQHRTAASRHRIDAIGVQNEDETAGRGGAGRGRERRSVRGSGIERVGAMTWKGWPWWAEKVVRRAS